MDLEGVSDDKVKEHDGFWWVQHDSIDFADYRGNPLKRLAENQYAAYMGKEVRHYIDGRLVGVNPTHVPAMAAQLNLGVWFPAWGGEAPWEESQISIASIKVWQLNDPGDVRGVLTESIPENMDSNGFPLEHSTSVKRSND